MMNPSHSPIFYLSPGVLAVALHLRHLAVVFLPPNRNARLNVDPNGDLTLDLQRGTWRGTRGCWSSATPPCLWENTVLHRPVSGRILFYATLSLGGHCSTPPYFWENTALHHPVSLRTLFYTTLFLGECCSRPPCFWENTVLYHPTLVFLISCT